MLATLELQLLGSPQIRVAGEPVATDRRKAVALLAYLAITAVDNPTGHSREALAAFFWPDYESSSTLAYLRRTLWEINRMLGDGWLDATREEVALAPDAAVRLDVAEFLDATDPASAAGDPVTRLEQLETAVALYRGDFMAGFTLRDTPDFDTWQRYQVETCRRRLAEALADLVQLAAEQQLWDTAVAHARRWVALDTLDEAAHRGLMSLYALQGQRAAALRQYESCVNSLKTELGVAPEPTTRALAEAIRTGELSSEAPSARASASPAPPATAPPLRGNLPTQTTLFIGRETERAEIAGLLASDDCRLLTVVGPGGIGKTRLALQTAVEQSPSFRDGAYFVPLAAVEAPEQVPQAVAGVLSVPLSVERDTPRQQLLNYLRERQMLVVLDNYEHLLNGHQPFALEMLAAAPHVKLLVTSRARLNVQGEHLFPLEGLQTPDMATAVLWHDAGEARRYSAIQLFQAAAERVRPGFQLSPDNIMFVTRICELVQGMPLAIELAASWMEILSPMEIAVEIAKGLDFLETEMRDVPERQRSIRAVFDGSWNLLSPAEQEAFRRLSIMRGAFSREAAQVVSQGSLRVLLGLANKSLLFAEGNGRFRLHELVRQYAAERLATDPADAAATRARYEAYFTQLLVQEGRATQGPDQMTAMRTLEREWVNVSSAWLGRMRSGDLAAVEETVVPLLSYFLLRGNYQELFDLLSAGLAAFDAPPEERDAQLLYLRLIALRAWASRYDWFSDRPRQYVTAAVDAITAQNALDEIGLVLGALAEMYSWKVAGPRSLELAGQALATVRAQGDPWQIATAVMFHTSPLWETGALEQGVEVLEEVIALYRQCDNPNGVAAALALQAMLLNAAGQQAAALVKYEESQALYEAQGNLAGLASNLSALASSLMSTGDYTDAMRNFQASRQAYAAAGERVLEANSLSWESITARQIGEVAYARRLREQAFAIYQEINDINGIAWSAWEFGEMARMEGRFDEARRWLEQSFPLFEQHNALRGIAFYHGALGDIGLAEGELATAVAHFETSLKYSLADSHFYSSAYAATRLGQIGLLRGNLKGASGWLKRAIGYAGDWLNMGLMLIVLTGFAQLVLAEDRAEEALRLTALILAHPACYSETRERATAVAEAARARLSPDAAEACERDGRAADLSTVAAAYLGKTAA